MQKKLRGGGFWLSFVPGARRFLAFRLNWATHGRFSVRISPKLGEPSSCWVYVRDSHSGIPEWSGWGSWFPGSPNARDPGHPASPHD